MRNKSARQRGKKKIHLHNIKVSSTTVWRYMTSKGWKALKRKRRRTCRHGVRRIWKLYSKGDRLANSHDVNPLETIWIIIDEKTYKEPAPKSLDELRQWLRFAWKSMSVDTLWELVHSMRGEKGLLRDTWLSVFSFRERWKYKIQTRELWLVCLSGYVNCKIFYPIFVIFNKFFREIVFTENNFYREACGPSNELSKRSLKNSKAGYLNEV